MAAAGGTFTVQNKLLPGSYVKFISAVRADAALSERGVTAILLETKWNSDKLLTVHPEDLARSRELFGFRPDSEEMRPLREAFCTCSTVFVYTVGGGTKAASSSVGTATCPGEYGNTISVIVSKNPDSGVDVITKVNGVLMDSQIGVDPFVATGEIKSNAFVEFDILAMLDTPKTYFFKGGTSETVTVEHYQKGLDRLESESFHTLAYAGENADIRTLVANYTRRMREECGAMFQCVLSGEDSNYRGVVNAADPNTVHWIAGALASCAVNASLTNREYNGECTLTLPETQAELTTLLEERKFTFYSVGGVPRVLSDRNSEDDPLFGQNQAVRVLDQIANDIGVLFSEKYLGKIQNNRAGRMSFWNDTVHLFGQLSELGAIEEFSAQDIAVEEGDEKSAVTVTCLVRPVCSMEKLYLTVTVS